jgi:hypothetical protein
MTKREDNRNRVLSTASAQVGYRAGPQMDTVYGNYTQYRNQPWDGSFLTWVFSESGVPLYPATGTTALLQSFVKANRLYVKPRGGDIAFFAFPASGAFGQPHVGLVSLADHWKRDGSFKSIEGMAMRPGSPVPDAVVERVRYSCSEVVGFGRPEYGERRALRSSLTDPDALPTVAPSHFVFGKRNPSVTLVQIALAKTVGATDLNRGMFDARTRAAFQAWERRIGTLDGDGQPHYYSLAKLADETNMFKVRQ